MRINILLILLFSMFLVVNSQTNNSAITIKGIMKDEADLSARTGKDVKVNANGDNMAIIKINTRDEGFEFDIGPTKPIVVYKTGEVWVYVTPGIRWFSMAHRKYGKSVNYSIPIRIESSGVYVLDVEFKNESGDVVTVDYGFITVKAEPKDALVYVDNELVQSVDGEAMVKYAYGTYTVRVERDMYHPFSQKVNLKKNTPLLEVNLQPNFGWLNITTTPEDGAGIILNGKMLPEKTPFKTGEIVSGEYTVIANKSMFKSVEQRVTVTDGEVVEVAIEMLPNFANITIDSDVEGAEIYVDDQKIGSGEWTGRLAARVYSVEVRKEGYITAKQVISVVSGEDQTIKLVPKAITGSLDIMCRPLGSEITINGIKYSEVTPTAIADLPIGSYEVTISKHGYATESRTINITENNTSVIDLVLTAGTDVVIRTLPEGAKLYIDNKNVGITPSIRALSFGKHEVMLENANGEVIRETIEIKKNGVSEFDYKFATVTDPNDTIAAENTNLAFKKISFISLPSSKVYINNVEMGDTPLILDLSYGLYDLEMVCKKGKYGKKFLVSNNSEDRYGYTFKRTTKLFITYGVALPLANKFMLSSYMNLNFGAVFKNVGFYLGAKSNFSSEKGKYSYDVNSTNITVNGLTNNTTYFEFGNKHSYSRMGFVGGLVIKIADPVYWYLGGGYGYFNTFTNARETVSGKTSDIWVKSVQNSFSGYEMDINLLFKIKSFGLSMGATTIGFKYFEANASVGVWF